MAANASRPSSGRRPTVLRWKPSMDPAVAAGGVADAVGVMQLNQASGESQPSGDRGIEIVQRLFKEQEERIAAKKKAGRSTGTKEGSWAKDPR